MGAFACFEKGATMHDVVHMANELRILAETKLKAS
jgi:hypothetical protein